MEQETEDNTVGLSPTDPMPFDCPKCGRAFKSRPALTMHTIRAHTKGWDTGQNFRGFRKNKTLELAKKREYNRRMRARFYAEGKNSRGEKMPPGWKPRSPQGGNKGMKLSSWSPERRAKFNSTWRSKQGKAKKFKPIVYPAPKDQEEWKAGNTAYAEEQIHIPKLKFCPNCGEHIEGWTHK